MPNIPIWRLLEDCAQELTAAGRSPFTRGDLISCIQAIDPSIGPDSINPIIQGITDNLKGGAPGAVGKDILHSVARGQFVLRASPQPVNQHRSNNSSIRSSDRSNGLFLPRSESELRDAVVKLLDPKVPGIQLEPEGSIQYRLPSGRTMSHASDILAARTDSAKRISIEIKYKSAVTDQFKARVYDAVHMKQAHGARILTVLLFAKSDTGISIDPRSRHLLRVRPLLRQRGKRIPRTRRPRRFGPRHQALPLRRSRLMLKCYHQGMSGHVGHELLAVAVPIPTRGSVSR